MRVSPLIRHVTAALAASRARKADRFQGRYDNVRLRILGLLLMNLAIVALLNSALHIRLFEYWPGMTSIFGGVLLLITMIKIARPTVYLDWMAIGIAHVALGTMVAEDPSLSTDSGIFLIFWLVSAASALIMVWIGKTLNLTGGVYLVAGGLTNLACLAVAILFNSAAHGPLPDNILATQLLILGLSLLGLGQHQALPPNQRLE